ncbi:multifunctional CCA tRNA nucleotidyl transferase/2'3'-cyclic phosphodiesterase/2'nucleotidase/phosphatase [Halieaceae bacterium IMCC14734]|uniref:CCA-adding enzyme n=1 Tax=Candidatus Litorirhabdus singularis TaxID=2518993 RepID=A0ABT3TM42_9GAMM|nr:multifunctional CCA tRNA nucleotidyl transferase/2'3'-cyclic phosphodiesterase/2'nucleotidase/phosphatase [Candidatus Litorirhabdus singularis]
MDVYLVGGAVRDSLLGQPRGDQDWVVVGATPQQMLDAGYSQIGKDFPVYLHPDTKEEYALARTERKSGHGYNGFTCYSDTDVTLEQDLSRRDLTINAIAQDSAGNLYDPYGGQQDLQQRLLRHVSAAFVEDPLRVLRVARFAARFHHLGFTIASETQELMCTIAASGELEHLPTERIWQELERSMGEQSPHIFFTTLQDCGALQALVPQWPLEQHHLSNLQTAAAQGSSSSERFACLLGNLPGDLIGSICRQLGSPKQHRELAELCGNLGPTVNAATDPEAILQLLESSDAWRREQRFEDFIGCCVICHGLSAVLASRLLEARKICHRIDTAQWLKEGVAGAEIGAKIRARRLQLLAQPAGRQDA